jgi:tetratricopeptide (TPR) repeat protein
MLPTDIFFSDIEKVIAESTDADRPRLRKLIEELDRIAERVPRTADRCYSYQARLYTKLQEYKAALAAVEKALGLMPMDDNLVILRGDIHREAQEYSQALKDYTEVLTNHPDAVTARMRRAEMLQAQGDYAKALEDINAALKHEPRSLRLIYRRALILIDLRRAPEAIADLKNVARLTPEVKLKKKAEQRLWELGESSK